MTAADRQTSRNIESVADAPVTSVQRGPTINSPPISKLTVWIARSHQSRIGGTGCGFGTAAFVPVPCTGGQVVLATALGGMVVAACRMDSEITKRLHYTLRSTG